MAQSNQLLKRGSVINITTESIDSRIAFPDSKAKDYYLELLEQTVAVYSKVNVLAYAILRESVYVLAYTADEKSFSHMMNQINDNYNDYYNKMHNFNGCIFHIPSSITQIKKYDEIISTIAHIHKLPEYKGISSNYRKYRYSSCYPIFKHMNKIVQTPFLLQLLDIKKLDGITYTSWHNQGMFTKIEKEKTKKERYRKAMDACTLRYRGRTNLTDEDAIKLIIMDVNERCGIPYKKIAKKMAISERRDILIEVISSMVFDRGLSYLDAIYQLRVEEYGIYRLLLEVILTVNERYSFGYDYIINKLKIDDRRYDILVELIKTANKNYGMGFVEIAKKFSLQNDIRDVRTRTGI